MRDSPRRPLILKRRKLSLPQKEDTSRDEPDGAQKRTSSSSGQRFPDGIRILDHPSMPNTQVVVIPKTANLQSIIGALTAKGKECGSQGPNKFILLSSGGGAGDDPGSPRHDCAVQPKRELNSTSSHSVGVSDHVEASQSVLDALPGVFVEPKPLQEIKPANKNLDCSPLDDSLTNIQWLGRMSTDSLGPCAVKTEADKENLNINIQAIHGNEDDAGPSSSKDTLSERPPYSYMAMIQFAINSKKTKRMTLKEIYTWIEDHFLYFRHIAKPGWKNSIRHNLSLHDMFIRETSPDGKISYWTIHPEANRCLTLDQVYKPVDPPAQSSLMTKQVCEQHQKRAVPELKKTVPASISDSYLVPIQLPLTTPLILPSATQLPILATERKCTASNLGWTNKRVRIAPKEGSEIICTNRKFVVTSKTDDPPQLEPRPPNRGSPALETPSVRQPRERKETSSSRRKQCLVLPCTEEPVIFFPESSIFDSGMVSDLSTFQDTREPELDSPGKGFSFKTPIKGSLPTSSSTPSKPVLEEPSLLPALLLQDLWRTTPLKKGGANMLDFSPIRTPRGVPLAPLREDPAPFNFSSTPFKEMPLFDSPQELLSSRSSTLLTLPCSGSPISMSDRPKRCSRELQIGTPVANHSVAEGLVLDTMNDSLSKILVDISFTGLEDEELGMDNISWSQLIPELK
ncbi:forkhead box protein M1-like isoform X2 [Polyodon spathula]|uniref:forkhead box protein M1-like isoform X2 n=1 Tax=Polyodon spathula TaxID=7913 RepID=UPI001B7F2AAF|nr:forkhead box protein M1-like isoform X2 [Polyodon spathula]